MASVDRKAGWLHPRFTANLVGGADTAVSGSACSRRSRPWRSLAQSPGRRSDRTAIFPGRRPVVRSFVDLVSMKPQARWALVEHRRPDPEHARKRRPEAEGAGQAWERKGGGRAVSFAAGTSRPSTACLCHSFRAPRRKSGSSASPFAPQGPSSLQPTSTSHHGDAHQPAPGPDPHRLRRRRRGGRPAHGASWTPRGRHEEPVALDGRPGCWTVGAAVRVAEGMEAQEPRRVRLVLSISRKIRSADLFRPRRSFGDGGAYPECHIAQYPLDMGRKKHVRLVVPHPHLNTG